MRRDRKEPLYMISVAARMLHVHPQTLRVYEKEGLVNPKRQRKHRLYSEEDIERLGMILRLTRELGVNRAGVDIIMRMRTRMESMQWEMEEMMRFLAKDIRRDFEERIRKIFRIEEE